MRAPFYQVKMVVGDVYVEYTTSDSKAMDKFLGKEEDVPTPKESEEYYYVVEDKVGDVTRILRTNDKNLIEELFRENL